jgi:hypothetical protein
MIALIFWFQSLILISKIWGSRAEIEIILICQ